MEKRGYHNINEPIYIKNGRNSVQRGRGGFAFCHTLLAVFKRLNAVKQYKASLKALKIKFKALKLCFKGLKSYLIRGDNFIPIAPRKAS